MKEVEAAMNKQNSAGKAEIMENNEGALRKIKQDVIADVLSGALRGGQTSPSMMRVAIKFAIAVDPKCGDRMLEEVGSKFRAYLNMPKDTPLADVVNASS